mmetsp:Transcript_45517/g.75622  ORF Transcript_45517/g.75622 Transcript_45517/m.75622 type:complete len:422 (+) Transcript_45517:122-1387(+)
MFRHLCKQSRKVQTLTSMSGRSFSAAAQAQTVAAPSSRVQPFFEQTRIDYKVEPAPAAHNESHPVIEPKFVWPGRVVMEPSKFTIDCSQMDARDIHHNNESLRAEMKQKFHDVGLVYVTNTGLTDFEDMRDLMGVLLPSEEGMEYKGGSNWRNRIAPNVYDTGAPKEAWLHYHHEMAYVGHSPQSLGFCAKAALPNGRGASYVSDQVAATKELLTTEFGQKLKDKGMCYVRRLTDEAHYAQKAQSEFDVYNHWQKSFGSDDPDEAVEVAQQKGLQVEWDWNHHRFGRYMKTKYYTDVYEYFPQLDVNLLYASVADHYVWFDTWPGVNLSSNEDRPIKITFGDDTDLTYDEVKQFVDIYDKYGIGLNWKVGDVAVMCNWRWAHGRPRYEVKEHESRELGVVLGPVFERRGQKGGKWSFDQQA